MIKISWMVMKLSEVVKIKVRLFVGNSILCCRLAFPVELLRNPRSSRLALNWRGRQFKSFDLRCCNPSFAILCRTLKPNTFLLRHPIQVCSLLSHQLLQSHTMVSFVQHISQNLLCFCLHSLVSICFYSNFLNIT